jgi:hypothetical protein
VVRREVAVRRELGGVGLGPAQVRGVPPVEQTMPASGHAALSGHPARIGHTNYMPIRFS